MKASGSVHSSLSIAPSLELKLVMPRFPLRSYLAINRTIFGIETTLFNHVTATCGKLSIAPSLELKLCILILRECDRSLSIAPSLELKRFWESLHLRSRWIYQSHHLWNWNIDRKNVRYGDDNDYQSHHLWNWNIKETGLKVHDNHTINRTIFGIETM